jgi:hypothetical protein
MAFDIAAASHGLAKRKSRGVLIVVDDIKIVVFVVCIDKKDEAVPFSWLVGIIISNIIIIGHHDYRL